jgi:serine/threonine-protein kinase
LKPDHANAWFNRGEILYDLGRMEEAIADYTESIRLNPEDAGAHTSRAHSYLRSGQADAALADYNKAIELAPTNADMMANRGDALQGLGKWLDAAADFNAAIKLDPESPRVLQSAAWLMATCPDPEVRNAQLAVQAAEKAAQRSGKSDPRVLDTLAAAYANANRFPEAVAQVTAAIQQAPADQAARMKKRLELYQQKKPYRQTPDEKTASISKVKKTR